MSGTVYDYHRLDHLNVFDHVRWRGPDDFARRLGLQPDHPGQLLCADETHAVIDWVSVPGTGRYDGRFNPYWVERICEQQYEQAAQQLRSRWPGFNSHDRDVRAAWTQNRWIGPDDPFLPDTRVKWFGDQQATDHLGLQPEHPGTVLSSSEKHAIVHWVDAEGIFEHEGVMDPGHLEAIDEEDFQRRTQALRDSGWRWIYYNAADGWVDPALRTHPDDDL